MRTISFAGSQKAFLIRF